jgi:hypothetical protein
VKSPHSFQFFDRLQSSSVSIPSFLNADR